MSFLSQVSVSDGIRIIALFSIALLSFPLVGRWMAWVFSSSVGQREGLIFKFLGINASEECSWQQYLWQIFIFHLLGLIVLMVLLMGQGYLPLNPDGHKGLSFSHALNIATSFLTNTNWQIYAGEASISHLSELLGLSVQNFLSAAAGLAVLACMGRALRRKLSHSVGSFWVDVTRASLFILLPLSLVSSIVFLAEGVPQNWSGGLKAKTIEGTEQHLPQGPMASRVAIKIIGSNGGGLTNANAAHPYENPTPFSHFLSMFLMLLLPGGCLFLLGHLIKDHRHVWALLGAIMMILIPLVVLNQAGQLGVNPSMHEHQFYQGIETRFGISSSGLYELLTTATSNGSTDASLSSMSPMAGLVSLFAMLTGEVLFGGVGSGVYTLFLFSVLTVFLAGLMVGRTPEYLGKKIQPNEVIWACLGLLIPGLSVLLFSGLAAVLPYAQEAVKNGGPHALTEIVYAFASASQNNGSAFAGLNAAHPFFVWTTTFCMLLGRFGVIVPVIALSGLFAAKQTTPPSEGTFPTHGFTFAILLAGVIVIVGALTFFPAIALGPLLEHFAMMQERLFVP